MLLTRAEMSFDFGGAHFDPVADRPILRWMLSQFLYGEVTGVQVGHWLEMAPDLESARFLARQAVEELQHVGNFLKVMQLLGVTPEPVHPVVRFLATGLMSNDWSEHVALEMATGEGFVLVAFYALIDTLGRRDAVGILERAARQEESHVTFGEQRCMRLIAEHPELKAQLLGANLVWMWGVRQLASYIDKHLPKDHPVLSQLQAFLMHCLHCSELRLIRMGLSDGPVSELSLARRSQLLLAWGRGKVATQARKLWRGPRKLTDTYLEDPELLRMLTDVSSVRHLTQH
jgi:hypothetical protein